MFSGAGKLAAPPWIQPVRWYEPLISLMTFIAGRTIDPIQPTVMILVAILSLGTFVVWFVYGRIRNPSGTRQDNNILTLFARLLLLWLFVPILIALIVSIEWPIPERPPFSIYVDRYLIITLPAFLLVAAWGIVTLAQRLRWTWLPAATVMAVFVLVLPELFKIYDDPSVGREDWRSALSHLEKETRPDDTILLRPDVLLPLEYYTANLSNTAELPPSTGDQAFTGAFSAEMDKIMLKTAQVSDRAWLITNFYISDPHGRADQRNDMVNQAAEFSPQRAWAEENYPIVAEQEYHPGIRVTLFDLTQSESN
jgi:hypothetical protein